MTFLVCFAYNLGLLFVAFVRHFKRTLILTAILTLLSGAAFLQLFMFWFAPSDIWINKR